MAKNEAILLAAKKQRYTLFLSRAAMCALHANLCGKPANRTAAGPPQQFWYDHTPSSVAARWSAWKSPRPASTKASSPSPSTAIFMAAKLPTSSSSLSTVPSYAPAASPPQSPAPPASSPSSSLQNGSCQQTWLKQSHNQTINLSTSTLSSAPPAPAPPTPSTSPCPYNFIWSIRIFFISLQSKILPNMTNNRQGDSYNRIKVVLVEQGKTSRWLAEQIGKCENTVSRWCLNKVQPTLPQLTEIARVLDVDVRTLICSTK